MSQNRVEIFVPKGVSGEEPHVFISVNGVNYLLPRGKKSQVPPEVAQEYERSEAAREALDKRIETLLEEQA